MIGNLTYRQSLDIVNKKMKEAETTYCIDFENLKEEVDFIVAEETIQRAKIYKIQNLIKKYKFDLHLCVIHPSSGAYEGIDYHYVNSKGDKFHIDGVKSTMRDIVLSKLVETRQIRANKREAIKMSKSEDFKKLDIFLNQLINKSFIDGENKISVVKKIGKAVQFGTQPHTFIVRIIEAYKDVDVSGRLVRSKMNVIFEVEYFASDYNDSKRAIKEVYDKFKSEWERRNEKK